MIKFNPADISCEKEILMVENLLNKIEEEKIPYPLTEDIRSPKEKSKIIELLFLRIPLREVYIFNNNFTKSCFYLTAKENLEDMMDFVQDYFRLESLEIFSEYNNLKYSELPFFMKRRIIETVLNLNTINSSLKMSNDEIEQFFKQAIQ